MSEWDRRYIPNLEWPSGRRIVLFEKTIQYDYDDYVKYRKTFDFTYIPLKESWAVVYLNDLGIQDADIYHVHNFDGIKPHIAIKQNCLYNMRFLPERIDGIDLEIRMLEK